MEYFIFHVFFKKNSKGDIRLLLYSMFEKSLTFSKRDRF